MKKNIIFLLLSLLCLSGCEENKKIEIDYSKYSFTGINWIRDIGDDTETIRFNTDGGFSYSCACGNPVNDADLCDAYTYNEDTREIKLNCFETTEDTITTIKVVSLTETALELDFKGELRMFEKENN